MKIAASLITVVMTFLGWDASEYAPLLPTLLRQEISLISTSTVIVLPPVETKANQSPKVIPKATKPKGPIVPVTKPVESTSSDIRMPPPSKEEPDLTPEAKIRRAVVNIYCTRPVGGQIAHHSGSGVIIDPSGIIITNAHVAEYILLEQAGRATCHIRTGSPATNSYKAKIVYLPDAWIEANKFNLSSQTLIGNGENDYALLMLTSRVSASAYDVPIPYIAPDMTRATTGSSITIAGYPILSQSVSFLASGLYAASEGSTIKSSLGYSNGESSDVIITAPSTLATHGTSGGAVVLSSGTLIGIVDSAVIDAYSGHNAVQSITLSYIDRSLQSKGKSLKSLIDNAQSEAESFATNKVQNLSAML